MKKIILFLMAVVISTAVMAQNNCPKADGCAKGQECPKTEKCCNKSKSECKSGNCAKSENCKKAKNCKKSENCDKKQQCNKCCQSSGKMLLIVDPQYDFINGSLAVAGAPEKMDALAEYIAQQPVGTYKQIVMTSDFHPYNHASFKVNGGLWPVHCVQYTQGAAIWQPVADAVHKHQVDAPVLTKGDLIDVDEYSILKSAANGPRLLQIIKDNNITEIEVAGLCGDYCVGNSIKDLVAEGHGAKITVLTKYIGNIDDGTVLRGIIKDNNLKAE